MVLSWIDGVRSAARVSYQLSASLRHRTQFGDGGVGVLVGAEETEGCEIGQSNVMMAISAACCFHESDSHAHVFRTDIITMPSNSTGLDVR
jgi:hypothetical protein